MSTLMLSPFKDTWRGANTFLRGLHWLRKHPKYMAYLVVPFILALVFSVLGWNLFLDYEAQIFEAILFSKPSNLAGVALYYVCKAFLYLGIVVIFLIGSLLLSNILSSPIYDVISLAVEKDMTGSKEEINIWASLKLIPEEIKRVVFILVVSLLVLMIPGFNTLSVFVTAFLVGWDLYDYPLARRGWSFNERIRFVGRDGWAVMGFGFWLVIPLVQILIMPLAVTGGTMLAIEALQKRERLASPST